MILLPWLLSRTAYLKRHALIERVRGTRSRLFHCVAKSESEKSPRVVYGLDGKLNSLVLFLKICPANNNSALNFASRVAN